VIALNETTTKIRIAMRFLFRERLHISPETIETRIRDHRFTISRQQADDFRSVVDDTPTSQAVTDLIHPLFLSRISWHIVENFNQYLSQPIEPKLLKTLVHLSVDLEYKEALEYDKEYRVKSRLCQVTPHRKGTRLTIRFEYFQDDRLVAVEHTTGILFGVKCNGQGRQSGNIPSKSRVSEKPIWARTVSIDEKLPYAYAAKAGIDAPIHTDPEFARSIGLPDIILQGTCTFAKAVSVIINEPAFGFEGVAGVSANFTGMLVAPNEIEVRVLFHSDDRLVFDVLDKDGQAVIKGGNIHKCPSPEPEIIASDIAS